MKISACCSVLLLTLMMSSCLKDWECQCTVTDDKDDSQVSITTETIVKQNQEDAETICNNNEGSAGGYTTTCFVKGQ